MVDSFIGEVEVPPFERLGWREGLMELMRSTRRFLLGHADLLPHLLARPTRGPNAIRMGEHMLRLLAEGGVEGQEDQIVGGCERSRNRSQSIRETGRSSEGSRGSSTASRPLQPAARVPDHPNRRPATRLRNLYRLGAH